MPQTHLDWRPILGFWLTSSKVLLPGDVAVIRAIQQGKDHPRRSEVSCELHCLAWRMPRATRKDTKQHFSKISFSWVDLGGSTSWVLAIQIPMVSWGLWNIFHLPCLFWQRTRHAQLRSGGILTQRLLLSPHWTLLLWVHHYRLHPRLSRSPWRSGMQLETEIIGIFVLTHLLPFQVIYIW